MVPAAPNDFTDFRCVATWSGLYENISNTSLIYSNKLFPDGCRLNYPKIWVIISSFFKLGDNSNLIIDAYPIKIEMIDIIYIQIIVIILGLLAAHIVSARNQYYNVLK